MSASSYFADFHLRSPSTCLHARSGIIPVDCLNDKNNWEQCLLGRETFLVDCVDCFTGRNISAPWVTFVPRQLNQSHTCCVAFRGMAGRTAGARTKPNRPHSPGVRFD